MIHVLTLGSSKSDMMDDTQLAEIAACANGDDSVTAQIIRDLLAEVKRRRAEAVADKDDRLVWQRMMAAEAEITRLREQVAEFQAWREKWDAEIARLRAIVATVEALPEEWRNREDGTDTLDCADELSAALGGKSK